MTEVVAAAPAATAGGAASPRAWHRREADASLIVQASQTPALASQQATPPESDTR